MFRPLALGCCALASCAATTSFGSVLAYWKFDSNTTATAAADGANVPHGTADGIFDGTTPDSSGNNNTLSTWTQGSFAGFAYNASTPVLPHGGSQAFSIKNTGGSPAAMSIDRNGLSGGGSNGLNTGAFAAFTVEASYKPENGGYRTIVGRDARDVANTDGTGDGNLAALYLQVRPDNSVGLLFNDVSGKTHEAFSSANTIQGFNFPTDPGGTTGVWYNLAAVSDGATLKMYVNGQLVATTDMTTGAEASTNAALSVGVDPSATDDWTSGGWTVGRGLYNGGHGDRAYGFIDEVRISDSALPYNQLLSAVPEPTTLTAALAALGVVARRRR